MRVGGIYIGNNITRHHPLLLLFHMHAHVLVASPQMFKYFHFIKIYNLTVNFIIAFTLHKTNTFLTHKKVERL
jgi:hypothetical protein